MVHRHSASRLIQTVQFAAELNVDRSDACVLVLEDQGEPQSSFWLASQVMEMKLW
jgi:hypothetical protein